MFVFIKELGEMGGGFETTYTPNVKNAAKCHILHAKYLKLGELIEFGMK